MENGEQAEMDWIGNARLVRKKSANTNNNYPNPMLPKLTNKKSLLQARSTRHEPNENSHRSEILQYGGHCVRRAAPMQA